MDNSIFQRVIIPNGFIPKGFIPKVIFFLSRKVIIPKIFIPKGHYSEIFTPKVTIFGIMALQNNNFSEL